jgi:hypothetical protein
LAGVPRWRMLELAARANVTPPGTTRATIETLKMCGVDLSRATEIHRAMGGEERIAELNRIGTHFSAMPAQEIQGLYEHGRWQVHAMHAIYWS